MDICVPLVLEMSASTQLLFLTQRLLPYPEPYNRAGVAEPFIHRWAMLGDVIYILFFLYLPHQLSLFLFSPFIDWEVCREEFQCSRQLVCFFFVTLFHLELGLNMEENGLSKKYHFIDSIVYFVNYCHGCWEKMQ